MGTILHSSMAAAPNDHRVNGIANPCNPMELDAGALVVLKSRGSWGHCGYHLTTSIVGPQLLTIPFSFALLGWVGGMLWLILAGLTTFYSYNLLSLVLEHHAEVGNRHLRFRDVARDVLGPRWAKYYVYPLQIAICYGAVIAGPIIGGQSLKFIYLLYDPNGTMKLYQFIIICGAFTLFLAQFPSFHSLRHINLFSLLLCLSFSLCGTVGSIDIVLSKTAPTRSYSLDGSNLDRLFGVLNGISIIVNVYSCGIIPEIQATIAPPVKGKMFKGLCVCYSVIAANYLCVGISGYWAFGNQAGATIIVNFMGENKPLLPIWFLLMANIFILLQVAAGTVVYLQPINELFETTFADPNMGEFSVRNVIPRLIFRSLSVITGTVLAAMLPFFGDIMALFGAFGCIPLDFILPVIIFNLNFKPSKYSLIFWTNTLIAVVSSVLVVIGVIASVRQIVIDAKTYRLFADV